MYHVDLSGPVTHPRHKAQQVVLVGVCRVAAYAGHLGLDGVALAIDLGIATVRAVLLNLPAKRTGRLVANEQDVVPAVAQHGLEVIDDAPTAAHAARGNHHRWLGSLYQAVEHGLVAGMAIDGQQVTKSQWLAPCAQARMGFAIPELIQLAVDLVEAASQRGVQDDRQVGPIQRSGCLFLAGSARRLGLAMNDVFQFVEQFLGTPDAESGDQHRALVTQRLFKQALQALATLPAIFVQAIAIGAFDDQGIGFVGRLGRRQDRRVRCPQVAGKHYALSLAQAALVQFDLDIGRAEDVPGALQAQAHLLLRGVEQRKPVVVGQRL